MHWACTKITASFAMPDSALLSILLDKVPSFGASSFHNWVCELFLIIILQLQLRLCKGIDYARVAEHADKSGRRKLAATLVEHEPCSSKQVSDIYFFKGWSIWVLSFLIYVIFVSGSAAFEHRRGRSSSVKGNRKWGYWSCIFCPVPYMAEGDSLSI